MGYAPAGACPHCGAPIYVESSWWGVTPPPNMYSCNCVPHTKYITSDQTVE